MSKNTLYANEIATAHNWIIEHNNEPQLMSFLSEMRDMAFLSHSDRWSRIYDWMAAHHPEATGSIVTGLTYWLEG